MELEEAIKQCKIAIKCIRSDLRCEDTEDNFILAEAIEIVLQELKNRIPKKKIEDLIKKLKPYSLYTGEYIQELLDKKEKK